MNAKSNKTRRLATITSGSVPADSSRNNMIADTACAVMAEKENDTMNEKSTSKQFTGSTNPKGTCKPHGSFTGTSKVIPSPRGHITRSVSRPIVKVIHGTGISLIPILILMVIRHFCPEIAAQLEPVYTFLDEVVIPVINWFYRLGMKCFKQLMEMDVFKAIIEWFANLAM